VNQVAGDDDRIRAFDGGVLDRHPIAISEQTRE